MPLLSRCRHLRPPAYCVSPALSFQQNSPEFDTHRRLRLASDTTTKFAAHFLLASDSWFPGAKESSCWRQLSCTTSSPTARRKTAPCYVAFSRDAMPKMYGL